MHECCATLPVPPKCGREITYLTVLVESDPSEPQSTPAQIHAATAAKLGILGDPCSFGDYLSLFLNTVVLCLGRAS